MHGPWPATAYAMRRPPEPVQNRTRGGEGANTERVVTGQRVLNRLAGLQRFAGRRARATACSRIAARAPPADRSRRHSGTHSPSQIREFARGFTGARPLLSRLLEKGP